ncbi:MAG: putative toxin-antitoxin system toxin component, PIN family [Candidatus Bathyarchaeia archaeon]
MLDTNVLVSAIFWRGNEAKIMELVESGSLVGYTSSAIIDELRRVLRYPRFDLGEGEVKAIVGYFLTVFRVVEPRVTVTAVRDDPADNRVLECALEARADYVVSGDEHLVGIAEYRGVRIVRAGALLESLERGRQS